jgi:hypothetical protein
LAKMYIHILSPTMTEPSFVTSYTHHCLPNGIHRQTYITELITASMAHLHTHCHSS